MKFTAICYILSQLTFHVFYAENKPQISNINTPTYFSVSDTITPQKTEEEIFIAVEQQPQFPNGENAMKSYIDQRIIYTEEAKKKKIEGRVTVQFVVEKDGSISKSKVLNGLGYGLDEVALDIIRNMPNWVPGYHNGKAVRVFYTVPVSFKINKSTKTKIDNNTNKAPVKDTTSYNKDISTQAPVQKSSDTTYYDKDWNSVNTVSDAHYYEIIRKGTHSPKSAALSTYYASGQIMEYKPFSDYQQRIIEGKVLTWYENGQLKRELSYASGLLHGESLTYWDNELPKRKSLYEKGELIKGKCFDKDGNEIPYFPLIKVAETLKGNDNINAYLFKNIKTTTPRQRGQHGRALFSFYVNEKGNIVNVTIHQNNIPNFETLLLNVLKKMPKWQPGSVDGEIEKMLFTMPFTVVDLR